MQYNLIIPGRLPGLNEYIKACRANKFAGAAMKKDCETAIGWHIKIHLKGVKITKPVYLNYIWYEKDKKRDLDGITSFGMKVIQDALVDTGVLQGDGWKNIIGFSHSFEVSRNNPRIEILIEEREETK